MKFKRKTTKKPGGSASSNPTTMKHRNKITTSKSAVKNALPSTTTGGISKSKKRSRTMEKRLTELALKKHDANMTDAAPSEGIPKVIPSSIGASTVQADVGGIGNIFLAVRQKWNSHQESDKEACAVLAAVTESITEHHTNQSPTAYWAALMSTLELTIAAATPEPRAVAAVLYLLTLVFPHVPPAVTRKHFSNASTMLMRTLGGFAADGSQALIKSCLTCLSSLLVAQEEAVWQASDTVQVYHGLLAFTVDTRPKVRKGAQVAVTMMMNTVAKGNGAHPVVATTAKFCIARLKGEQTALHILNLLVGVFPMFDAAAGKSVCQSLLKFLGRGQPHISETCMMILKAAFEAPNSNLPSRLLDQIIESLMQYKPALTDAQSRIMWNTVMVAAHKSLGRRNMQACIVALPQFCEALVGCYASDKAQVADNATEALNIIITDCIKVFVDGAPEELVAAHQPLASVCTALGTALKFRYQKYYPRILRMLSGCYAALGKASHPLMDGVTTSIIQMRSTNTIECQGDVEVAIGSALQAMGPAALLQIFPLDLMSPAPKEEFTTAWLLPIMKASIKNSEIQFFGQTFLPIAAQLSAHGQTALAQGNEAVGKIYETLYKQVWDLLPSFCNNATDVATSFRALARTLGTALSDNATVRPIACQSLVMLIQSSTKVDADRQAVAAFAKNFLPILFNIFCGDASSESDKARSLAAIEAFVPITDSSLITGLLGNVFTKLQEASTMLTQEGTTPEAVESFQKQQQNMLDLCLVLAIRVDQPQTLLNALVPLVKDPNPSSQKKAYKCLALLCNGNNPTHGPFVQANTTDLMALLMESMALSAPAAKHQRMAFIGALISCLDGPKLREFVPEVIAEIILSCKEVNERARAAAYECLVVIGNTILSFQTAPDPALTIHDYFSIVVAGLAGQTPHMMSATILALSRLIFQFRSEMDENQTQQVLGGITMLLQSRAREIVKSALGFIKVALVVMPNEHFEKHLEAICVGLVQWSGPTFRMKVKMIFERLIRKFGYERMEACTPIEHRKILVNIRKRKEREKRNARAGKAPPGQISFEDEDDQEPVQRVVHKQSYEQLLNDSDDGTDADAEDEDEGPTNKRGGRKHATYIQDAGEDDTVDLLDPSMASRLKNSRPKAVAKAKGDLPYDIAKDGRWIIEDDTPMATDPAGGAAVAAAADGEGPVQMNAWSERMSSRAGKKRARQKRDDDDDDDLGEKEKTAKSSAPDKYAGSEYRAKKAGGDVKIKGKPQPYAFMPFDTSTLNRRKRAKAVGEFKGMMKGAKVGAMAGRAKAIRVSRKKR